MMVSLQEAQSNWAQGLITRCTQFKPAVQNISATQPMAIFW
jgi:hypothetical protein